MVIRLKRCPQCQRSVERDLENCPWCGNHFLFRASRFEQEVDAAALPPAPQRVEAAPHDVSVALSASLLAPGTGQMYNRQHAKGWLMLFATLAALVFAIFYSPAFMAVTLALWLISMVDAALVAGRILNGDWVTAWHWF